MCRRIVIAAVAACFSSAVHAQVAPPLVPQCECNNPPMSRIQATALRMVAGPPRIIGYTAVVNCIETWTTGCQQAYSAAMVRWQAESQRVEMLNRQRCGN